MSTELTTFHNPSQLTQYLQKSRSAIEMALPKHLNPDRMVRLAVTCFSTTPALRNCTPQSILASIVVASQLGLEPGVTGQAYLIPYGKNCTLVPGWQGLVGLLNNSGRATAWTGAVFEGDVWDFQLGSNPKCIHIPGENYGDTEKLTWVYACGKVNGSEQPVIEAWNMARVWRHRDRFNKVGQKHYSYQHPEMYARKVVLLQVLKYMPRSIELNNAIVATDAAELGHTSKVEEGIIVDVVPDTVEEVKAPPAQPKKEAPKVEPEADKEPAGGEHERQEQNPTQEVPDELPSDPAALIAIVRGLLAGRDVEEADALRCLKKLHKAGAACKSLSEAARSGLEWLVRNPDALVKWVNENRE